MELSPFFRIENTDFVGYREFTDTVIGNVHVRMSKNDDGSIGLLYGFIDPHTILITNNIFSFKEIDKRYKVRKSSSTAAEQPDVVEE